MLKQCTILAVESVVLVQTSVLEELPAVLGGDVKGCSVPPVPQTEVDLRRGTQYLHTALGGGGRWEGEGGGRGKAVSSVLSRIRS